MGRFSKSLLTGQETGSSLGNINLDEKFRKERLDYLEECIKEDYRKYLNVIKKRFPSITHHEDLLQESIIVVFKRLKKSCSGETESKIFSKDISDFDLENFAKSFLLQSIKQQAYFIFINEFRKNNMVNACESKVKEFYYGDEEDFSFSKFKENYDLQEFYSLLSSRELAVTKLIIDETPIKEICTKLKMSTRTYYNMIEEIRKKIVNNNYIDTYRSVKQEVVNEE